MVAAHLPSFLRTPCLRVSFSQCRKPTYVALSHAPSLHRSIALTLSVPLSRSSLPCLRRATCKTVCALCFSAPFIGLSVCSLFRVRGAATLEPETFWSWTADKLPSFIIFREGLVLTRRYSGRRIQPDSKSVRDVPNTFSRGANNLCDQACMHEKSQCS